MTTTVESLFGSGRAVGGFFLNNQLTDFSFQPVADGAPVANAVAGGKRPRSSMAPVIVLDAARRPVAALGSPGGSSILAYNAKALVGLLAWKLPLQQAIDLPNVIARGDEYYGEVAKLAPGVAGRRSPPAASPSSPAAARSRGCRASSSTPTAAPAAPPTRAAKASGKRCRRGTQPISTAGSQRSHAERCVPFKSKAAPAVLPARSSACPASAAGGGSRRRRP